MAILLVNVDALPVLVARVFFWIVLALALASGLHYIWRSSHGIARHSDAAPPPAP